MGVKKINELYDCRAVFALRVMTQKGGVLGGE